MRKLWREWIVPLSELMSRGALFFAFCVVGAAGPIWAGKTLLEHSPRLADRLWLACVLHWWAPVLLVIAYLSVAMLPVFLWLRLQSLPERRAAARTAETWRGAQRLKAEAYGGAPGQLALPAASEQGALSEAETAGGLSLPAPEKPKQLT